jgi:sulfide:quinone oxidoreductase
LKIAVGPGLEVSEVVDGLFVGGQVGPDHLPALVQKGFRSIACTRFDGEEPGQPTFMSIDWAAAALGMRALYFPVLMPPRPISDADAFDFAKALDIMPKPVLGYCRNGKRSLVLWALSEARRRPFKEILLIANSAGHDLSAYIQRFQRVYGMRW